MAGSECQWEEGEVLIFKVNFNCFNADENDPNIHSVCFFKMSNLFI